MRILKRPRSPVTESSEQIELLSNSNVPVVEEANTSTNVPDVPLYRRI